MPALHHFETIRQAAIVMRSEEVEGDVCIQLDAEDEDVQFMSDNFEHGKCKNGPKCARMSLQGYIRSSMEFLVNKAEDTFTIQNSLKSRLRKREFTLDPFEKLRENIARRVPKGRIKHIIQLIIVMALFSIGNIFERMFLYLINRFSDEYIKQTEICSHRAKHLLQVLESTSQHECYANQCTMMSEVVGNDSRVAAILILQLSYLTLTEHKASKLLRIFTGRQIQHLVSSDLNRIIKGKRQSSTLNGKLINMQEYLLKTVMEVEHEHWNDILVEKLGLDPLTVRALVENSSSCSGSGYQPKWASLSEDLKICVATYFFLRALKNYESQGPSTPTSAIIQNLNDGYEENYVVDNSIQYSFFNIRNHGKDVTVWIRQISDISELSAEVSALMDAGKQFYLDVVGIDRT